MSSEPWLVGDAVGEGLSQGLVVSVLSEVVGFWSVFETGGRVWEIVLCAAQGNTATTHVTAVAFPAGL